MTRTDATTKKTNHRSFYIRVLVVQVLAALVVLAMVGLDPAERRRRGRWFTNKRMGSAQPMRTQVERERIEGR